MKKTYKLRLASYWYTEQYEQWFSHMALQGLYIKRLGTSMMTFEKGEPRHITYRIALTQYKAPSREQIARYEENGWQYVTSHQYFHVFAGEQARDVQEDAEAQLYKFAQLKKKHRTSLILLAFAAAIYIILLVALWQIGGTPILRLVEGTVISQTVLSTVLLYNLREPLTALQRLRQLENGLKTELQREPSWQVSWQQQQRLITGLFLVLMLCTLLLPVMQLVKLEHTYLAAEDIPVPFIQLADVENHAVHLEDGSHYYAASWGLLAPVQYTVREYGTVIAPTGETLEASVETKRYDVRPKWLAAPLMHDLMKWHSYGEAPTYTEHVHPDVDYMFVRQELEKKEVFAVKKGVVLYVRYFGEMELEAVVNRAVRVIEEARQ